MRVAAGAAAWIAAALGYVILEAVAAAAVGPPMGPPIGPPIGAKYSYAADYISTLGAPARSPRAAAMNAAFCWQGTLFLLGALLSGPAGIDRSRYRGAFLLFAAANAVGNILVAMVHSGSGAWAHGLGALLAIVGGNAAIVTGSTFLSKFVRAQAYRVVSWALAGAGFTGLTLFVLGANNVGFWERLSVYSILLWQTLTAVLLLGAVRREASRGPGR